MLLTKTMSQAAILQKFHWKRLTQVEIGNHLFPYMFNPKGDNLRQRGIQIEFETVW